uniref:Heparan-alpha-glucosaminide N-acetyltransferase n=1 Tax=Myripristis murdjan TaxID=586833 RepID=A0A667XMI5_9TELE
MTTLISSVFTIGCGLLQKRCRDTVGSGVVVFLFCFVFSPVYFFFLYHLNAFANCFACMHAFLFLIPAGPHHHHHHKYTALKMDVASLTVNNELVTDVVVSWKSEHCYKCLFQQLGVVPAWPGPGVPSAVDFTVNTQHGITLQVNSSPSSVDFCSVPFHFGEHGNYSLWVKNLTDSGIISCSMVTDADPVNNSHYCLIYVLCRLDAVKSILFRLGSSMETERLINSELGSPGRIVETVTDNILPPLPTPSKRLRSLDTFRGISLVIMVFVNYGGGRYWFFRHESWNGEIMFVFIMGTSIALSVNSLLRVGTSRCSLLWKTVWRSLQLFIIGVLIINPNYCQGPLSWYNLRIPGVLQRLAWSYLVVACLNLLVARVHMDNLPSSAWWYPAREILLYWPAWLCMLLLEMIWLCLTFLLPVPGCPTGYLGPGGIGDMGLYPNCTGGAAGYIDRWLLGESHIYQTPSSRVIYATHVPFDPEGVLGSINSIFMTFLGLQAGYIILHYKDLHSKIMSRFLIWGLILRYPVTFLYINILLHFCSRMSLSYVTTLACFAFVMLVLVYYTVDVKKWWSGAPFYYPGMNSILVYVGHEVFEEYFPFRWQMINSQSHAEHLTQNLVATSCWVFISYVLYRKKIFWKI